jgi:hypothetical protein
MSYDWGVSEETTERLLELLDIAEMSDAEEVSAWARAIVGELARRGEFGPVDFDIDDIPGHRD